MHLHEHQLYLLQQPSKSFKIWQQLLGSKHEG